MKVYCNIMEPFGFRRGVNRGGVVIGGNYIKTVFLGLRADHLTCINLHKVTQINFTKKSIIYCSDEGGGGKNKKLKDPNQDF